MTQLSFAALPVSSTSILWTGCCPKKNKGQPQRFCFRSSAVFCIFGRYRKYILYILCYLPIKMKKQ